MEPPQLNVELGGRINELINLYTQQSKKQLCDNSVQKVSDTVYVSLVEHLSLSDYIIARRAFCDLMHTAPCTTCEQMLMVAQIVSNDRYCSLCRAYSIVSPDTEYHSFNARRKLLQMPLVSVCVGDPAKGRSFTILIEHSHGANYSRMSLVLSNKWNGWCVQCK